MPAARVSDQQFAETRHQYTDPRTGLRLIGVTSVVKCFDDGDKLGAGAAAALALAKQGINYRQKWNAQRDLGIRVHGYVGRWASGLHADVLETDGPYLDGFQAFCEVKSPVWLESERAVVWMGENGDGQLLGYGGRFDLIGIFDDCAWLIDLKCGRHWPLALTMQLAAHRYADGMVTYDDRGNAATLEPMPFIERCGGLYLAEDGTATLHEVDADVLDFTAFRHQLAVKAWANSKKPSRKKAG